jgi:hypothetical protein
MLDREIRPEVLPDVAYPVAPTSHVETAKTRNEGSWKDQQPDPGVTKANASGYRSTCSVIAKARLLAGKLDLGTATQLEQR